jgi:hypothetical protein
MVTPPSPLAIVLTVTIVIPFLVLATDYVLRVESGVTESMRTSGPDLCLLGLGSVGSVFIDPKIASSFFLPPQVAGTVVVIIIFLLRGICFRLQKRSTVFAAFMTMVLGIASITIIGSIIIYGYTRSV